jgi:hypothetical protein
MDPPEEGAAIPAGVFPGAAPADPAPEGLNNEPGPSEQDGLFRLAEGGRVPDAAGDKRILPETRAGAADPGASGEAPAEAASASSRRARGAAWEEPGPVKKDRAGSAETRNSRKNRERFVLEVRDLRTEGPVPGQEPGAGLESGEERVVDLVAELRDRGGNQEPEQPGQAKTAGRAFEDILARELHQNLNGDIVRQASILVKDGGEGTVRLSLKPESLGMVKVRLEMAENKITGRIIVESNEALRAFEREIHSLEQAFRDSGFAGASLEMALAGDGGHNSRGQRDGDGPFLSAWRVSSSYDGMAEAADVFMMEAGFDGFAGPGASRVNMLA